MQFYVDLVPYSYTKNDLRESIERNEPIQSGDNYPIEDHVEIRTQVKDELKPLAKKINNLQYIKYANPDMSPKRIKRGLSVYIDFGIDPPKGLTQDEIDQYYKYSIRFSEHEDLHGEDKNRYYVELEGRKLSDLYYVGLKKFKSKRKKIQDRIRDFELKKFGKQLTYITDEKPIEDKNKEVTVGNETKSEHLKPVIKLRIAEGVSLNEKLEEVAPSTYATNSAQDIADWIVNKPKPYRIIYDKIYDIWCIADANMQTHKDMSIDLFDSGYLYDVAKDLDGDIKRMRKEDKLNFGWTNAEVYSDYQFDHYNMKGLIFVPNNMNYRDYEKSGFYDSRVELKTGTIFVQIPSEFSANGIFKSLYYKLKIMDAIKPDIEAIFKKALVLNDSEKIIDYLYSVASNHGYSDSEIAEFIDNNIMKIAR